MELRSGEFCLLLSALLRVVKFKSASARVRRLAQNLTKAVPESAAQECSPGENGGVLTAGPADFPPVCIHLHVSAQQLPPPAGKDLGGQRHTVCWGSSGECRARRSADPWAGLGGCILPEATVQTSKLPPIQSALRRVTHGAAEKAESSSGLKEAT